MGVHSLYRKPYLLAPNEITFCLKESTNLITWDLSALLSVNVDVFRRNFRDCAVTRNASLACINSPEFAMMLVEPTTMPSGKWDLCRTNI